MERFGTTSETQHAGSERAPIACRSASHRKPTRSWTAKPSFSAILLAACVFALVCDTAAAQSTNTTLKVIWLDWLPCYALRNVSKLWTGGTVEVDCVSFSQWYSRIFGGFRRGSSEYDVVIMDSQWIGEAVYADGGPEPFIVNLTDVVNAPATRKSDFVDAALISYSIFPPGSSDYWGLPFNSNIQLIMYRKSIFQTLGLATPGTFEELVAAMDAINRSGLIRYPFTMSLCRDPSTPNCHDQTSVLFNQLAWMFGGQLWDESTYRFRGILNSPENIAALDFLRMIFVNYTNRNPNSGSAGTVAEFCSGQSAMMIHWFSAVGSAASFQATCGVASDVGFFAVPRVGQTGLHILQIGGVSAHVSSFSRNIPAAINYSSFITSRAIQKIFSSLGGYSVRKSVLAEPDFLFSSTGQCTSYRYVFLQSYPLGKDYWNIPQAQQMIGLTRTYLSNALTGNMTSAQALSTLAGIQEDMVLSVFPCGPVCPAPSRDSGLSTVNILIIAFVCGIVVTVLVLVLVVMYHKRKHEYPFPKPDEWSIPPPCITTVRRLGEGAFGVVFLARYERDTPTQSINKLVAAKLLRQYPNRDERRMFIQEAATFKQACTLPHPNIVQLIGTCLQGDPMMIIMEYMGNGDVKTWLTQQKQNGVVPAPELLLRMARDAAAGMAHLAQLKLIHCDLAARNCMLDDDLVLKITDWGQAHKVTYQQLYRMGKDAKERVLPIRWMAPEALLASEFSTSTDVWSYGVLLWEIYSHGAMPYHPMSNKEVFEEIVKGYRLSKPRDCPSEVYQVILACWSPQRPDFKEIQNTIEALMDPTQPRPPSILHRRSSAHESPHSAFSYIVPLGGATSTIDESTTNTLPIARVDESVGGNDSRASASAAGNASKGSPVTVSRSASAAPGHITWLLAPTTQAAFGSSIATNPLSWDDESHLTTTTAPASTATPQHVTLPMPDSPVESYL